LIKKNFKQMYEHIIAFCFDFYQIDVTIVKKNSTKISTILFKYLIKLYLNFSHKLLKQLQIKKIITNLYIKFNNIKI